MTGCASSYSVCTTCNTVLATLHTYMLSNFSRSLILACSALFLTSVLAFGAETANKQDERIQLRYEQAHMAVQNKNYHEAFNRFSKLADV
jgi:hypothetical protein